MARILGLDVGSNSVGSAWIDTETGLIQLGVSVFPAGVSEKSDSERGAPLNQKRRQVRSQRRSLHRKAQRKRELRQFLTAQQLLPAGREELQALFDLDPWTLRRDGLRRELTPHEFGRVLVHLTQRRGAIGLETDGDEEAGKVKQAIEQLRAKLNGRTVGEFFADLIDDCRVPIHGPNADSVPEPVRNRAGEFRYHADRPLIREEFHRLWEAQKQFRGPLSRMLTDELRLQLDNEDGSSTWWHRGVLFGQRRTYWNTGTLGRCELEPTDHQCPKRDRDAQEFILLGYVNDLRIDEGDGAWRRLTTLERNAVLNVLRTQKTAKARTTLRKALKIDTKSRAKAGLHDCVRLNVEVDEGRDPPTDWFHRCIIHVFGEAEWSAQTEEFRDGVNRTLLRYDSKDEADVEKVRQGAGRWWKLAPDQIEQLIEGWQQGPRRDDRVKLSRRAIRNLLPYLREGIHVSEARKEFAGNPESGATPEQRQRYAMTGAKLSAAERHYMAKHQGELPPAPMMANPVVRKAIHEVRRHVNAYIRRFGTRPDYIVVELAREAKTSEKRANEILARNRKRDVIRKKIIEQFNLSQLSKNQEARAVERILLCRQQKGACAYSGRSITERMAADGTDLEVDHIVPRSRSHDNSMANKVLVFRESNRNKGDRTVKEWLAHDPGLFGRVEQVLRHLADESPDDYFTKIECRRKWENLHKDAPSIEQFLNSQLTDTAYASRQVVGYLRNALYSDVPPDGGPRERGVFTTKGQYTAILRREWGLVESQMDRELAHVAPDPEDRAHGESGTARRSKKDRRDHLHHAIDALCIAFSAGWHSRQQELARIAQRHEQMRGTTGHWGQHEELSVPEPWQSIDQFRHDVMEAVKRIVVSHRAVKRNLVGAFHEETLLGPVIVQDGPHRTEKIDTLFTNRISSENLTGNHLRMPEGWDELYSQLSEPGLTPARIKEIRRQLSHLPDPSPAKSGIVRDRELRHQIRVALRGLGLDPDNLNTKQLQPLVRQNRLCLPSGVPIKRVVLLRTSTGPVRIPRKQFNPETGRYERSHDSRMERVYVGGNNHHIEIREAANGRWTGTVISTFEAAQRVRPPKDSGRKPQPAVNRTDNAEGRFVMSLSQGEIIFARKKDATDSPPGYFVVCKLDTPRTIFLAPHWDARRAGDQARWTVTPSDLKELGPEPGVPPYKVTISPLGDVMRRND